MTETSDYIIPITASTGKTIHVVPCETALRFESQRNEARIAIKEAWLAMDEIEGTDRINEWQNKHANIFDIT